MKMSSEIKERLQVFREVQGWLASDSHLPTKLKLKIEELEYILEIEEEV